MVGAVVVCIVVTAGMVSTTYVQFLKGGLLVVFSLVLTVLILNRGLEVSPPSSLGKTQVIEIQDGKRYVDGTPIGFGPGEKNVEPVGRIVELPGGVTKTGPLNPIAFLSTIANSKIEISSNKKGEQGKQTITTKSVSGQEMLSPGNLPTFKGIRSESWIAKLDFISLMVAVFAGTA